MSERNGVRLGERVVDVDGKSLGKVTRLYPWGFVATRGLPVLTRRDEVIRYDEVRGARDGALVVARSDHDLFDLAEGGVPRSWRVPQNTFAARCVLSVATVANPVARCNAFHDSLAVLSGLDRYLFGAAATPPSPPFDTGAAAANEGVYHYASAAALAEADALIRRMARNDSGFYLSVRTWRNESHLSWWPQ